MTDSLRSATLAVPLTDDDSATEVTYTDQGSGRATLLLHGGGGPQTVAGLARLLAGDATRVIAPTHPGFAGTPRPPGLRDIRGLAPLYTALLAELDLTDVTVVGNSIGGWIAAEMALLGSSSVSGLVLVDAVGIDVPGHPVADFFSLTPDQLAERSWHNPDAFRIDPSTLSDDQRAVMAANRDALALYGDQPGCPSMTDPGLADRLAAVNLPTLVLWGDSDQIVDPDYGRAYARAIPGARFELLPDTGHLPQLETPQQLVAALTRFTAERPPSPRSR